MPSLETLVTKSASVLGMGMCRYRGRAVFDGLERAIDRFHRRLNNCDFVMERNGELRVLRIIAGHAPKVVFDVGANIGEWTAGALKLVPSCTVHAFEIVPATHARLAQNLGRAQNLHLNDCGLSSTGGPVTINLGRDSTTSTACRIEGMKFHDEWYSGRIHCRTVRAEDYLREHAIDGLDYVKIDVEGMDLQVIKGFGDRIRDVRALQFEYGIFNIASHDLLGDFFRYLNPRGFLIGKIFPKRVVFSDYHFNMENFHGSNYVAVRSDETELIGELAGKLSRRSTDTPESRNRH